MKGVGLCKWNFFICYLWSHLRYLMLICALPWLSALCCLVLHLMLFCYPAIPHFFVCFVCFFFSSLMLVVVCIWLWLQKKTNQKQNPYCGAHKSASLNVLVAVDDLLSAPVPLLGLLWLVASLLGLGCVVWTEQFTPVWPSCRQVSFLWEVFQWNPRGERFFGGWPFPASNVSTCFFSKVPSYFCLFSGDYAQASEQSWIMLSNMIAISHRWLVKYKLIKSK